MSYELADYPNAEEMACLVSCEHGGACTREDGHEGDHATHGQNGTVIYCVWPQSPDEHKETPSEAIVKTIESVFGALGGNDG